jgi:hypothetical protein
LRPPRIIIIVENRNESREAMPPEKAKEYIAAMNPEIRALYEEV